LKSSPEKVRSDFQSALDCQSEAAAIASKEIG
jgi:hypothetical protein